MDEPERSGANRDDLGRYLPGVSGNPCGKPAGTPETFARKVEKVLQMPDPEFPDQTIEQCIASTIIAAARNGDRWIIREVLKRMWPEKLNLEMHGEFQRRQEAVIGHVMTPEHMLEIAKILDEAGVFAPGPTIVDDELDL